MVGEKRGTEWVERSLGEKGYSSRETTPGTSMGGGGGGGRIMARGRTSQTIGTNGQGGSRGEEKVRVQ